MKRGLLLIALLLVIGYTFRVPMSTAAPQGVQWPLIDFAPLPYEFDAPVYLTHAGDGSGRLFIVEQPGTIRVIENGLLLATPFLDLTEEVIYRDEMGLLSMAFSPNYTTNGEFYVNYTERSTGGDTYIVRYRVSAQNPNVADPASAEIVLAVPQPYENHNGGQLQFGPDGMLYIGMGDGGSGGDPQNRAQNPAELLGKMLRIDVETGDPASYTVPADNPFVGQQGYRAEIWQMGLRNPWRFSFDRETGDMYIGDVGQRDWEEINFQPAASNGGENWGWRCYEGTHEFNTDGCQPASAYDMPIFELPQSDGHCAITGGYVYRGAASARMQGIYFFTDYCSGTLWGGQNPGGTGWVRQPLASSGFTLSSFGEDEAGNLYIIRLNDGVIRKFYDHAYNLYLPLVRHGAE